jgi:hypothetical protein
VRDLRHGRVQEREVELCEVATWPPRADDQAWIDRVVAVLRGRDPAYAEAVAADGLCARFRPAEVAGACLAPALPVGFEQAVAASAVVARRYDAVFPPAAPGAG